MTEITQPITVPPVNAYQSHCGTQPTQWLEQDLHFKPLDSRPSPSSMAQGRRDRNSITQFSNSLHNDSYLGCD